jgi:uncharacterized protein
MASRLADSVSPYLQSHADNPVDWWPWGAEAFAEAARLDVPVLVSIGYATCHWCHVMARETFADPAVGEWLAGRVLCIKVDREEHPEVDAAYMTAASAFSDQLGWPLTVFATPDGRVFYAATYLPPQPMGGIPSFRQVVEAVLEAWRERRDDVLESADGLRSAIAAAARREPGQLPTNDDLTAMVAELASFEDDQFGGFGGAPKFPVAPALLFLQARAAAGDEDAAALASRTFQRIAGSDLRDPVEGGFFRYATRRDWSEPHYERMLNDNALLLEVAARAGARDAASGVVRFLTEIMRVRGGLASGQDSESLIDGERTEGGYYALTATARAAQPRPALDGKVLTGWNGLAIGALAVSARLLDEPDWARVATELADELLAGHLTRGEDASPRLLRASRDGRASTARAALEDYGDLAVGLLELAITTGDHQYATIARDLIDACLAAGLHAAAVSGRAIIAAVPGGGDPVLEQQGLSAADDPNEGSAPSGEAAVARAALLIHQLTAEPRYRFAAEALVATLAPLARTRSIAFGATLAVASSLGAPSRQLVVVRPDDAPPGTLEARARGLQPEGTLAIALTASAASAWAEAGFSLLDERAPHGSASTAFACTDFVCRLPVTTVDELDAVT